MLFSFNLFNSTVLVVVALANLSRSVFVSIKLSQIGSFHKLLALATECFISFDIFEIHSDVFFGFIMRCASADGSWEFWDFDFIIYVSELCLCFVFILDAIFCGTIFFHFPGQCVAS